VHDEELLVAKARAQLLVIALHKVFCWAVPKAEGEETPGMRMLKSRPGVRKEGGAGGAGEEGGGGEAAAVVGGENEICLLACTTTRPAAQFECYNGLIYRNQRKWD
jgi:hypothetical protein